MGEDRSSSGLIQMSKAQDMKYQISSEMESYRQLAQVSERVLVAFFLLLTILLQCLMNADQLYMLYVSCIIQVLVHTFQNCEKYR